MWILQLRYQQTVLAYERRQSPLVVQWEETEHQFEVQFPNCHLHFRTCLMRRAARTQEIPRKSRAC